MLMRRLKSCEDRQTVQDRVSVLLIQGCSWESFVSLIPSLLKLLKSLFYTVSIEVLACQV